MERKTLRNRLSELMSRRDTIEVVERNSDTIPMFDSDNEDAALDALFAMSQLLGHE